MRRSPQHPYTTSHTTAEARNPRFLMNRIPVLLLQVLQVPRRNAFGVVNPSGRQHMKECRAQNVTCNGCGIKGHLKKCCKKSGNFPKDDSKRQNQSSSTGTSRMNFASTLPQTEAEFFDEKGLPKDYNPQVPQQHTGSMFILKKVQDPNNAIFLSEDGVEIQHSVSDPDPAPNPYSRFPIPRISAHGSSKSISKGFLQHFRYVGFERMQ